MNNSPVLSVPTNTPTTPNHIGLKNVVRRRSKTIDGNSENKLHKRPPTPYIFPKSSNLDELNDFELPKPAIKIQRERSFSMIIPLKK